jgi:glycerophosphoryl diester phosphodiesterase
MWSFPSKVIAHRGGGTLFPENTLEAIQFGSKTMGYRAVEFDVMLANDHVPLLMHDNILSRTIPKDDQHFGLLFSEVSSLELSQKYAGTWFGESPEFQNVRIPLFKSVLEYCKNENIFMNIEIKPAPGFDELTGTVVGFMTGTYYPVSSEPLVGDLPLFSSFSYESLMAAKKAAPHIPRGFLVEDLAKDPDWLTKLISLEAVSVHTSYDRLTDNLIQAIQQAHLKMPPGTAPLKILCYTVNDVTVASDLLRRGVDAFCTDRLDLFQGFISQSDDA